MTEHSIFVSRDSVGVVSWTPRHGGPRAQSPRHCRRTTRLPTGRMIAFCCEITVIETIVGFTHEGPLLRLPLLPPAHFFHGLNYRIKCSVYEWT